MQDRLADFRDAHLGDSIVVCGCGESLNLLHNPERFVTIGVNDVGRRFTPNYLVVVNPRSQFAADRFRHVSDSQAGVLFTQLSDLGVPHRHIVSFQLGSYSGTDFGNPDVLHFTQNSPYVAVCLAVHMGASRIGVIGVDFTDHHFFGSTGVHPLTSRLDQIDREYAGLFEACRARGIEVFNLSPMSRLKAFPKLSIEAFGEHGLRTAPPSRARSRRRIFFVHYRFLSAGDVFEQGLRRAAADLGVEAEHVWWDDIDLAGKLHRFDPDLMFVVHGRRFAGRWRDTLRGRRSAVWLLDEPYEVDDTASWSGMFDNVFVNDPSTIARHRNAKYLPVAYDPGLHFSDSRNRDLETGFVGGYNSVRQRYLVALAEAGRLSYVVGGPWSSPILQRIAPGLNVAPEQVAEFYRRTRLVINVFRETHHFNRAGVAASSLNPRIYEALACGAMVVSEPRSEILDVFPSLPTFSRPDELIHLVAALGDDPARTRSVLDDCRLRLAGHTYADRLAEVIRLALDAPVNAAAHVAEPARLPAGWIAAGAGIASFTDEEITIIAGISEENGLVTEASFKDVRLAFDLHLDPCCRFIAKIHQSSQGDRNADSYHVVISPDGACIARHNIEFERPVFTHHTSHLIEIGWSRGALTLSVDGHQVCCCFDSHLSAGFCAVGATGGTARVRNLRAQPIEAPDTRPETPLLPAGWIPVARGAASSAKGDITIVAGPSEEAGLVTESLFGDVRLSFDFQLDSRCRFIAKIHQGSRGDWSANSYHFVSSPEYSCIARHDFVFANVAVPRNTWQRLEIGWMDGIFSLSIDGHEICRRLDGQLKTGFCAIGATGGTARLRNLGVEPLRPVQETAVKLLAGWHDPSASARLRAPGHVILRALEGRPQEASLVTERDYNDVELEFTVQLSSDAAFIAKVHGQDRDNGEANSYHLVSTRSRSYVARHGRVFGNISFSRGGYQHVLMRWVDQYLEVRINGILHVRVFDQLLQSGFCVLAVSAGEAELANIAVRDVSDSACSAPAAITRSRERNGSMPFTSTPRRNLIYHVWPVRGRMWRWNLEQLKKRIDLFNGRRLIGIVYDARSEDPEAVRASLEGHGCEFVEVPNNACGEVATFPTMLKQVASSDVNEVTFYGHAKGVRHEPSVPATVQRWAEVSYRATLDDWLKVRAQLEEFALTGSFRMLGRFRAHQYAGAWHYSGTYYWLRHALVFSRGCFEVPAFYGGVEAWPGIHFSRDEAGCLLFDDLRQLPYHEEFWRSLGPEVARWEAEVTRSVPPPDLVKPFAFEGFETPRIEQKPDEFEWLLRSLVDSGTRSLLTIGAMHGGVEWHIARRFRDLGRDIRITAVELRPQRELIATVEDAGRQFGQQVEIVEGDSTAIATRARIAPQYDAVFIDGDHSYRSCRADFEFALSRRPRLIGLHDIVDSDWHAQSQCCVSRLWAEVRGRYVTEERTSGVWGGIGIVRTGQGNQGADL